MNHPGREKAWIGGAYSSVRNMSRSVSTLPPAQLLPSAPRVEMHDFRLAEQSVSSVNSGLFRIIERMLLRFFCTHIYKVAIYYMKEQIGKYGTIGIELIATNRGKWWRFYGRMGYTFMGRG